MVPRNAVQAMFKTLISTSLVTALPRSLVTELHWSILPLLL